MAANKFVLKGPGVEVDYTIGASSAIPALVFTAGAFQKKFKPNEVLSEDTGLGRLVSVALILTIDTGGERFGFFLPFIDVARDQTAHFYTVGVQDRVSSDRTSLGLNFFWKAPAVNTSAGIAELAPIV